MRWGLVPYWAKDMKIGFSTINAQAETVDTKSAFRSAFERRRCLVPVENFYEWQKTGPKDKQPYAIALADRGIMALAGLWENWKSPAGEWVRSFTIITTMPNELCAPIHNRMPVILPPETWPAWLGEEAAVAAQLKALLAPYPADRMTCWPVDKRVGNVRNNDPSLIEPIELTAVRRGITLTTSSAVRQRRASSGFSPPLRAARARSRLSSSIRARIAAKSSAARGRSMISSPGQIRWNCG
jgi:putative SOS response-associated peptidase YedK